jgi:hypothetical protein
MWSPAQLVCIMVKLRISRPNIALLLAFAIAINTLLISGLIRYGNDTAYWDIPYRAFASALAEQGDLHLWYPGAGNGFPHLNLQWVSWVFNPLGVLLSFVRPYDYLSLAVENVIWRMVGFAGAFVFARQWTNSAIGALAIAATYVGSGTMSWAALSYSALIGQMFAPWILAAGSLAVRASSIARLARATGTLGLVSGLMVWCAYPGAWLTAPVLSGPVLITLCLSHRGALPRLLLAAIGAAVIATTIILAILSESTSITLIEGSVIYSRTSPAMREGFLRGVDLIGLALVNPSYMPGVASPQLHPLYSGILPVAVLASLLGALRRASFVPLALATACIALLVSNTQNWTLWDHPVFREIPAIKTISTSIDSPVLLIIVAIPVVLTGAIWGHRPTFTRVDWAMLFGMAWVTVVAGDNVIADLLRFNVPPFVLVRYNHLYFWLVTLLGATLTWRVIEQITFSTKPSDLVPPSVRAWGFRVAAIGVPCLGVAALAAMATPDAYGLGAPPDGVSAMGSPHLAWQATILVIGATTGYLALRGTNGSRRLTARWAWTALTSSSVIAFVGACAVGFALRRAGITPPTVAVTFAWQLIMDLAHGGVIIAASAIAFVKAQTQSALRTAIAAIMIFDVSLAVPRYFSDNDTAGAAMPGWPFPPYERGHGGDQFLPQGNGSSKRDFVQPFSSSFSSPPPVSRLRKSWGALYDQWVYFPATWTPAGAGDIDVRRDSIDGTLSMANCGPRDANGGNAPRGVVTRLLATTVNVSFTADCDRLLVFTDSWAPGWSAAIDGTPVPVLRVNNAIRAVMAPAGDHTLTWTYRPRFLTPLLSLLALGLGASVALIAAPWWSRRVPFQTPRRVAQLLAFGPFSVAPPMDAGEHSLIRPVEADAAPPTTGRHLPTQGIALALVGVGVTVATSLALHDARIDGSSDAFQLFLLRSAIAGAWAWVVVAGRVGFASPVGPALMALVLLPPVALQLARHVDPITRGAPVHTVTSDFRSATWQGSWEVVGRGASPDAGPGGITLRNDGSTARAISHPIPLPSPALWAWWQRPLGTNSLAPSSTLAWTATIDRSGPYYTVLKLDRLTIQALKGGILVTAPAPGGDVRGDFIENASPDGSTVLWQLATDPASSSLSLDGRRVWTGGSAGPAKAVVFGDASPDAEHRGAMTVASASVTLRLATATR